MILNVSVISLKDMDFKYALEDAKGSDMSSHFKSIEIFYFDGFNEVYDLNVTPNLISRTEK